MKNYKPKAKRGELRCEQCVHRQLNPYTQRGRCLCGEPLTGAGWSSPVAMAETCDNASRRPNK